MNALVTPKEAITAGAMGGVSLVTNETASTIAKIDFLTIHLVTIDGVYLTVGGCISLIGAAGVIVVLTSAAVKWLKSVFKSKIS